jgi:hypothetical protein
MEGDLARSLAALLLLVVSLCIAGWQLHVDRNAWSPDGAIYLRLTMQNRGVDSETARTTTNQFMLKKLDEANASGQVAIDNSVRPLYADTPPLYYTNQFALFRNRPLYPFLAASIYPKFGPVALKYVSLIAYVAAVMVMFFLLLSITSILKATIGALVFATEPVVLSVAAMPLTDELALLFWTCAFGAILSYARKPAPMSRAMILISSLALTFTRPAFFLPLGAAIGAYLVLRRSSSAIVSLAPLGAAIFSAAAYFVYSTAVHGPSITTQLHWQYAWQQSVNGFGSQSGPVMWYVKSLALSAYRLILLAVPSLGGIIVVFLAAFGLRCTRTSSVALISLASAIAIAIAVFANPLDVERPVLLPLAPLVIVLAIVAFDHFFARENGVQRV